MGVGYWIFAGVVVVMLLVKLVLGVIVVLSLFLVR
jgi:hypothetical protein